jgi:hypothetical protein
MMTFKSISSSLFITFVVILSLSTPSMGQDSLVQKFDSFRVKNPIEKIFLHIDRTGYVTGETMWFKVYCTNGSNHKLSAMSKVAYVEIISISGQSVVQGKIELTEGVGHGTFFLPATLSNGGYTVRAYTNWMKNYGHEYFYEQSITIINPFKTPEQTAAKKANSVDAQFLPEGGNLVHGIPGKIAFRVTDSNGKGISFRGSILTANGNTVVSFTPTQFGIGTFEFTPDHGEQYKAVIVDENNNSHIVALPQVQTSGFSLRLNTKPETIELSVMSTVSDLASPVVYLFVHCRNQIISSKSGFLKNGSIGFTIDKNDFGEGVNHITIFDANKNPVCERLYFRIPKQELKIALRTDNAVFATRENVKVAITTTTESGVALEGDLSLSVYRRDSLSYPEHQKMVSYFLLSSDLKGRIESPDFYFEQRSEELFDQLMLTHGWRRFTWSSVLKPPSALPEFTPELQELVVHGKLLDETGRPAKNIVAYFASPSNSIQLFTSFSDASGRIKFALKNFHGSRKVILQTDLNRDSLYEFKLDDPFVKEYRPAAQSLALLPEFEKEITDRSIGMQIEDIFRKDTVENDVVKDTTSFYGTADEIYYLDDFTRFPVMEEVMREYVPGVWVRKRKDGFYFKVLDNVTKSVFQEEPLVLLDGVPVFDIDKIMAFDPLKIRKLEVMTRLFFVGRVSFPGIVSYSTYTGDLGGFTLHPKSITIDFEGLQNKREFYHPKYDSETTRSSREPDQRHLLLWSPEIKTVNGKAEVEFYTSDRSGTFQIDVHGISKNGRMGSSSWSIFVKPFDQ